MKNINQVEIGKSFRKFLAEKKISINQAAKQCKLAPSQVQNILDGKNYGAKFLFTIMNEFKDWEFSLQYFKQIQSEKTSEPEAAYYNLNSENGIPIVSSHLLPSFLNDPKLFIKENKPELYFIPEFETADFLLRVYGTEMTGKYNNGEIIACKNIDKNSFIQWNKLHAINTEQGVLVKRLCESSNKNNFLLKSDHPDFEAIEIKKREIFSIALIIGSIRTE